MILATAVAFLGLGIVVCLVLPRAYAEQARESLRERSSTMAQGVAFLLADGVISTDSPHGGLERISGMLDSDPDFDSAVLVSRDGRVLARWPENDASWTVPVPDVASVADGGDHYLGVAPVGNSRTVGGVAVRTSTDRLRSDLENVRWLFAAIFAFTGVAFWVLSSYLARGIVDPLEQIRAAAVSLADGEPMVAVPSSGDREIDELGRSIDALGRSRRESTLMPNPLVNYLKERTPQNKG
ncbi:MAG: HAMP domain-containing protein [Gemmatimonadetes bacterium]|nr:HAMP domain-containing protein [Gemmatimonadota bacterium]